VVRRGRVGALTPDTATELSEMRALTTARTGAVRPRRECSHGRLTGAFKRRMIRAVRPGAIRAVRPGAIRAHKRHSVNQRARKPS
jgi:hypothetical protein